MRAKTLVATVVICAVALVVAALAVAAGDSKGPDKGPEKGQANGPRQIPLSGAPAIVRDAATTLSGSRIAHAITLDGATYVVISTGSEGERLQVEGIRVEQGAATVSLRRSPAGNSLYIGQIKPDLARDVALRVQIDGGETFPTLSNPDGLPVPALPPNTAFVVLSPKEGTQVGQPVVEVVGYARVGAAKVQASVYSPGKGRVLGHAEAVPAAQAPNWGSFRLTIPVELPAGVKEGVVLVYEQESGAKVAIPVKFGAN